MKKQSNSPLGVASKQGNMFNDKRQSYQPGVVSKKTPLDVISPTQTKMGELDDDDEHNDEEELDENDSEGGLDHSGQNSNDLKSLRTMMRM